MALLKELFWALLILGLPMMVLTLAMVYWALYRGIVGTTDGVDALSKEIGAFGKARKKQKKKPVMNPLHHKWFEFGGGFYGLTALYTYLLIEFDEVIDFITSIPSVIWRFDIGAAISLLVSFFINALMNFIAAISWPVFWMREGGSGNFWLWLLVAWASYWAGLRLAQYVATRHGLKIPDQWSGGGKQSDEGQPD